MDKRWRIKERVSQEFLSQFPQVHPIIVQLLCNRGLQNQKEIDEFLNSDYSQDIHDPYLMPDMGKAVERIFFALEKQERVVIHGDYDADGVCASALLKTSLDALGLENVSVFLPHRQSDGYGLNVSTIEELKKESVSLILTVDCGITNVREVESANQKGIDVILTDHHEPPFDLPKAYAIIHPAIKDSQYPFQDLSGAGVAFKLAQAIFQKAKRDGMVPKTNGIFSGVNWEGLEKWLLDLVAIATVADVSTLLGENRTLVKYGLMVLSRSRRIGLQELFKNARIKNTVFQDNSGYSFLRYGVNSQNIGFAIAPRINSAGRIDHSNTAYQLLMAEEREKAKELADGIERTNSERQKITDNIFQQAQLQAEKRDTNQKLIACSGANWPLGVIGLVSGKLSEAHYLPSIVIGIDANEARGSGRSIEEFHLIEALKKLEKYLLKYGGHAQACGFTLKNISDLEPFISDFKKIAYEELKNKDIAPLINAECEISLSDISWDLIEQLENFEPFGEGNPRPKFALRKVKIDDIQTVGADAKHLRMVVSAEQGLSRKIIGFSFGAWQKRLQKGDRIDMIVEAGINEWNGNREIQLKLVDVKKAFC